MQRDTLRSTGSTITSLLVELQGKRNNRSRNARAALRSCLPSTSWPLMSFQRVMLWLRALEPCPLESNHLETGLLEPGPLERGLLDRGLLESGPLEPCPLEPCPLEPGHLKPGPLEPVPLEVDAPRQDLLKICALPAATVRYLRHHEDLAPVISALRRDVAAERGKCTLLQSCLQGQALGGGIPGAHLIINPRSRIRDSESPCQ